jgi:hypothetical protein
MNDPGTAEAPKRLTPRRTNYHTDLQLYYIRNEKRKTEGACIINEV